MKVKLDSKIFEGSPEEVVTQLRTYLNNPEIDYSYFLIDHFISKEKSEPEKQAMRETLCLYIIDRLRDEGTLEIITMDEPAHDAPASYFAYGMNMDQIGMQQRCPNAEFVSAAFLKDYRLAFLTSGVATILPKKGSTVAGALWKITPECEKVLDRLEGFPHFYGKETVEISDNNGGKHSVMAYTMTRPLERQPHNPSAHYMEMIASGYKQAGLPLVTLHDAIIRCKQEVDEYNEKHFGSQRGTLPQKPAGRKRGGHER